jgi:hypothetical protein
MQCDVDVNLLEGDVLCDVRIRMLMCDADGSVRAFCASTAEPAALHTFELVATSMYRMYLPDLVHVLVTDTVFIV